MRHKYFADEFIESRFSSSSRILSPAIGQLSSSRLPDHLATPNKFVSNTTILSLLCDDAVVTAADRRISGGFLGIVSDKTIKIHKLTNFSNVALSGVCSTIYEILKSMQNINSTWESHYGKELSPDGQVNYLSGVLQDWFFTSLMIGEWLIGVPVMAAYDVVYGRPRIFEFAYDGYFREVEDFAGEGCGWEAISGLMKDNWKQGMGLNEGIELAVRGIARSGQRSSGVSPSDSVLPSVTVIDREGFRLVSDDTIQKIVDKILW